MLVVALLRELQPQGVAGCSETGVTDHGERLIQTAQYAAAALKQLTLRGAQTPYITVNSQQLDLVSWTDVERITDRAAIWLA